MAGLIDGEGYLGLHTNSVSKVSFTPCVKVVTTDPIMCPYLHQRYSGAISSRKRYKKHWTTTTEWSLTGSPRVKRFLSDILPYMLVKRSQAELLLAYIEECGSLKGYGKRNPVTRKMIYDENFLARRLWYAQEGKRLRHQYRAAAETE